MAARTPSQTVGPYYAICLPWENGARVTGGTGARVVLTGRVLDGNGAPINDALVETWQPLAATLPAFGSTKVQAGRRLAHHRHRHVEGRDLPHRDHDARG